MLFLIVSTYMESHLCHFHGDVWDTITLDNPNNMQIYHIFLSRRNTYPNLGFVYDKIFDQLQNDNKYVKITFFYITGFKIGIFCPDMSRHKAFSYKIYTISTGFVLIFKIKLVFHFYTCVHKPSQAYTWPIVQVKSHGERWVWIFLVTVNLHPIMVTCLISRWYLAGVSAD